MRAYLQFGGAHLGAPEGPYLTKEVPVRKTYTPCKGVTQTGYGAAIPTSYMVNWKNRWRRVYVACYSNIGTAYIGRPGAWEATVNIE